VTAVTGQRRRIHLALLYQNGTMKGKWLKLAIVCLLCLGLVTALVLIFKS
jgi:hypothetical protein